MFPGEQFLSHHPPNYEDEWKKTISLIVTLFLCMIFVLPTIAKSIFSSVKTTGESLTLSNESKVKSLEETTKRRKGPKRKKDRRTKESIEQFEAEEKEPIISEDEIHVPLVFFPVVNLICFLILFMIICLSPNNSYSARRVFIAPLLKESECSDMIDLANRAAEQNAENVRRQLEVSSDSLNGEQIEAAKKILLKPAGWSKDRHTNYPTTDLNVVVTFAKEDKLKLKKMLVCLRCSQPIDFDCNTYFLTKHISGWKIKSTFRKAIWRSSGINSGPRCELKGQILPLTPGCFF